MDLMRSGRYREASQSFPERRPERLPPGWHTACACAWFDVGGGKQPDQLTIEEIASLLEGT
jgi:hypothetical protein